MTAAPRLLKVNVQVVLAAEGGDGCLEEITVAPITLTAGEWQRLAPAEWVADVAARVAVQMTGQQPPG